MAYVSRTDSPYYDADRWQDEIEAQYQYRPTCDHCGEKITSDYAYTINCEFVCEDCKDEILNDVREDMNAYDEYEAYKEWEREDAR